MELVDLQTAAAAGQEEGFRAIVGPLENAVGRALNGPGLTACRLAFAEHPEGFARIAADALERGRNPLALLCRLVGDGDHRTARAAAGALDKALSWAENTGCLLEVDHREEILAGFGLSEQEAAQVRLRLLSPIDVEPRYTRTCEQCGAFPCICDRLAA